MSTATVIFTLILLIYYPSGKTEREMRPVEVPACTTVENSQCGIQQCMARGRERAAVLWGRFPGLTFGLICKKPDSSEEAVEGSVAPGGHPALNFR